jgi:hypothetical protein
MMDFELTPEDIVDRDEDGNVIQVSHGRDRFPVDPAGMMDQTPAELADEYVRAVSSLYGIKDREMSALDEAFTAEPRNEKSKLRRDQEKSLMETTVVSYQQTYRGLPVWNSTLSVVVSGDPPQVVGSSSTIQKDVEVEAPPAVPELRDFAAVEAPKSLEEMLGVDNSAGEGFVVNGTRMLVYGYDPDERYDPASQASEADEEMSAWPTQHNLPTLPLPPVVDSIKSGEFYVVREVLFSLSVPDWGELNWRAFVEVGTESVLYLRALTASASCCVYLSDPVTTTGNLLTAASSEADLNAARSCTQSLLGLDPPVGGVQSLNGEFVRALDTNAPTISPPTETSPFSFEYSAVTDEFAAVNGYYNMDAIYRMVQDMGFDVSSYFDGTTFPIPVDHRGKNSAVNASANGNTTGTGMGKYLYGLVQAGQPIGIAAAVRVCLHEFGHGLLWDHVGSPNFGWCHSAGDTMAAVLHDPGSKAPDRFATFPFLMASNPGLSRRHDRAVADGWAWGGTRDDRQYGSEQILSTLMFRIYQAAGGDDGDINVQRFAARYLVFLIIKAIGTLVATTTNPVVYVNALMGADQNNVNFEGQPGGAWHKLFRWSFEKQGLYQPPGAPTPVTQSGAPPAVDVYIDDGRDGEYAPYLADFGNTADIWNRLAGDGGTTHQPPAAGSTNFLYVRVKNRGTNTANNVVAKAYQGLPGTALEWPAHWQPLTTAQVAAGSINSGGSTVVGPFAWTPIQTGAVNVLVSVSAPGDESNVDIVNGAISNSRLVPLDNNLAQRNMNASQQAGQGMCVRMGSGSTVPGATNWQPYGNNTGIYVDVDTSGSGFTATPKYITSLGGRSSHWSTTGATSIYRPTPTSFRVYVRRSSGGNLTPAYANSRRWHINWFGIEEG